VQKVQKTKRGKHEEVKLVHEVKQQVGSRGGARHTEERSVIFREEVVAGRSSMTTSEERVFLAV